MNKIDVSVVIVSFNTKDLTVDCIKSVRKHTKNINYEIIVVDNNSDDGSVGVLKSISDRFIGNDKNLGFGSANNQGIKKSKGDYVLLLNSDTKLTSNALKQSFDWMEKNSEAGIMGCKLKNADGSTQVSEGYFPTILRVFNWMFFIDDLPLIGKFTKPFHPSEISNETHKSDWVMGSFFMIRRGLIKNIGFFDEDYFMYTEEVDYCYRAQKNNWETWYVPTFSIIHYGGSSSTSEFAILSEYKGLKTFYKKHYNKYVALLLIFLKLGSLIRIPILGIIRGPGTAKTYAKAFLKS